MPERTHCNRCGLPVAHCFHQTERYRNASRTDVVEYLRAVRALYEETLYHIPMGELQTLRTPRRWQLETLHNHMRLRLREPRRIDIESEEEVVWNSIEEVERVSAWARIMQDDD